VHETGDWFPTGIPIFGGSPHRRSSRNPLRNKRAALRGRNGVAGGPLTLGFRSRQESMMLWTLVVILLVLWLLGFFAFHVAGGFIHLLLVIAVIVVVINLISGRRAV
jgi:hypothetical protein